MKLTILERIEALIAEVDSVTDALTKTLSEMKLDCSLMEKELNDLTKEKEKNCASQ